MTPEQTLERQIHVNVNASQREPLRRIWRYVGYDEVNYTYTPNGRELLGKLGQMSGGPYFIRAHYLLCSGDGAGRPKWGSTNVYTEDAQGNPIYSMDILDRVLDTILEAGCVPFVELGFMPEALTTAPAGTPYDTLLDGGWRYPPKDYAKWQALVQAVAEHCLHRYGLREVGRWYWELWNEPDIFYWAGTIEEYCRLYDYTVAALESAHPALHVGGPATTNPYSAKAGEYLRAFLEHCVHGVNAVTGERGTRLDFISFHTKGGGYRRDVAAAKQTPTIHALVRNVVVGLEIAGRFPELAGREVILTECDPDGMAAYGRHDNANLQFRNTEYYASYVASAVCQMSDLVGPSGLRVDGLLTWAFQFENREYFEGLRTLSTNGIDKPVLGVFKMLAKLGGLRLRANIENDRPISAGPDSSTDLPRVSALAAIDEDGRIQVLLASHHDDWDVHTRSLARVELTGLEPGCAYRVQRYLLDASHSNTCTAWLGMGAPQQPTADELRALRRAAEIACVEENNTVVLDGRAAIDAPLDTHSVCLLILSPA